MQTDCPDCHAKDSVIVETGTGTVTASVPGSYEAGDRVEVILSAKCISCGADLIDRVSFHKEEK